MGLTIHYSLASSVETPRQARELVTKLRERALRLPLANVGEIVERRGAACDFQQLDQDDPDRWLLIQARQFVEDRSRGGQDYSYSVTPSHVIAFSTWPGEGCEEANFGLCQYPRTVRIPDPQRDDRRRTLRTGLAGWQWGSFCKTQYASNPDSGGVANFLRCHLSVIALLDQAQALGILADVSDEGDFWKKRDAQALAQQLGEWNEKIAGFFGQLKDRLAGEGAGLEGSIAQFPNFEHLEAKGRTGLLG